MQTLLGAKSVDWNQAWREMRTNGDSPARQPKFWDGRAPSFAKHVARTDYARNFLKIMKPRPDWSVLDMGCGGGTLALPLSDRVGSITAVDFSEKMISILREQCTARGIRNIRTLCARWEDDWRQAGIGIHDVAIASRSLVVEDLQGGIEKLDQAARKRVYIVTTVGDGPHDRNAYTALGRELKVGPDYIYNYNLLYQMGIYAKVDFIDQKIQDIYDTREEAVESVRWMFRDLTREEEDHFLEYMERHLLCRGGRWMLDYARRVRWAVLWWDKG